MSDRERSDEIYDIIADGNVVTKEALKKFLEVVFVDLGIEHTAQILGALPDPVTKERFFLVLATLVQRKITTEDVLESWFGKKEGISPEGLRSLLRSYALEVDDTFVENMMDVVGGERAALEELLREDE
jgi:hypothetical protein